jgi:hypothetical protein
MRSRTEMAFPLALARILLLITICGSLELLRRDVSAMAAPEEQRTMDENRREKRNFDFIYGTLFTLFLWIVTQYKTTALSCIAL